MRLSAMPWRLRERGGQRRDPSGPAGGADGRPARTAVYCGNAAFSRRSDPRPSAPPASVARSADRRARVGGPCRTDRRRLFHAPADTAAPPSACRATRSTPGAAGGRTAASRPGSDAQPARPGPGGIDREPTRRRGRRRTRRGRGRRLWNRRRRIGRRLRIRPLRHDPPHSGQAEGRPRAGRRGRPRPSRPCPRPARLTCLGRRLGTEPRRGRPGSRGPSSGHRRRNRLLVARLSPSVPARHRADQAFRCARRAPTRPRCRELAMVGTGSCPLNGGGTPRRSRPAGRPRRREAGRTRR